MPVTAVPSYSFKRILDVLQRMFFEFFLVEPRYLDLVEREIAEFLDVIMGVRDKQVDGTCAPVLISFRFLILSCMIKQRFCL